MTDELARRNVVHQSHLLKERKWKGFDYRLVDIEMAAQKAAGPCDSLELEFVVSWESVTVVMVRRSVPSEDVAVY